MRVPWRAGAPDGKPPPWRPGRAVQRGRVAQAAVHHRRAAAGESADGRRRVDRAADLAVEPDARPAARNGRHQRLRAGVRGLLEDVGGRAHLDDLTEMHHRHTVGQQAHDVEVVRDEERGKAELPAQLAGPVDGVVRRVARVQAAGGVLEVHLIVRASRVAGEPVRWQCGQIDTAEGKAAFAGVEQPRRQPHQRAIPAVRLARRCSRTLHGVQASGWRRIRCSRRVEGRLMSED